MSAGPMPSPATRQGVATPGRSEQSPSLPDAPPETWPGSAGNDGDCSDRPGVATPCRVAGEGIGPALIEGVGERARIHHPDVGDSPVGLAKLTIAPMSRRASRAPLASPVSKSPSVPPVWFVTWAKQRTGRPRAKANA